jgi:chromosome segregation ATPase
MARAGVNFIQVSKAAEALTARGLVPTVERIRQELGTGSSSTLAPLLKQWKALQGEAVNVKGLPGDLIEVVRSLHERMQSVADVKIETMEAEKDRIIANLRVVLSEANIAVTQLKNQQQRLETELQSMSTQYQSTAKELDTSRMSEEVLRTQQAVSKEHLIEIKTANEELKRENRTIREQVEHYQQHIALDRQQEREQFRTTTQQLQNQVDQTLQQYQKLEHQHNELSTEKKNIVVLLEQLRLERNAEQQLFMQQQTELLTLTALHQDTQSQLQTAKEQVENLHASNSHLHSQLATVQAENSALRSSLNQQETLLATTVNSLTQLTDENNIVLQEKSMLQGQLKQLQQSL